MWMNKKIIKGLAKVAFYLSGYLSQAKFRPVAFIVLHIKDGMRTGPPGAHLSTLRPVRRWFIARRCSAVLNGNKHF
jgi:hypothetical protein